MKNISIKFEYKGYQVYITKSDYRFWEKNWCSIVILSRYNLSNWCFTEWGAKRKAKKIIKKLARE